MRNALKISIEYVDFLRITQKTARPFPKFFSQQYHQWLRTVRFSGRV